MDSYSDYDMEMMEKGARTVSRYIIRALERKTEEYAKAVLTEPDPNDKLRMIGKMDALLDFKIWMIEDGDIGTDKDDDENTGGH